MSLARKESAKVRKKRIVRDKKEFFAERLEGKEKKIVNFCIAT
jgi:hypothetical protein